MTLIQFSECTSYGYAARTYENAKADVTIAFAVDFTTAGEKCTKNAVIRNGKSLISLRLNSNGPRGFTSEDVAQVLTMFNRVAVKYDLKTMSLNIAGNGLYTLSKHGYTQDDIDTLVYTFLKAVLLSPDLIAPIREICTGGQTGVDEAGAMAAKLLSIPCKVVAPKGWLFRGADGKDVGDEAAFKARFD